MVNEPSVFELLKFCCISFNTNSEKEFHNLSTASCTWMAPEGQGKLEHLHLHRAYIVTDSAMRAYIVTDSAMKPSAYLRQFQTQC